MRCETCKTEHGGEYASGRFCSNRCARSFSTKNKRKNINEKISKKLTGTGKHVLIICAMCKKEVKKPWNRRTSTTCSKRCSARWRYHPDNPTSSNAYQNCREAGKKSAHLQSTSRRSKNEIDFYERVKEVFPEAMNNIPMFDGWDADIIIPSHKIAIHWDGPWHWKQIHARQSLNQIQTRDKLKREVIESFGFINYTIKDTSKKSKQLKFLFVQHQFENFMKFITTSQFEK